MPYAKNPRVISSAAIEKVASSIKQFGFRQHPSSPFEKNQNPNFAVAHAWLD